MALYHDAEFVLCVGDDKTDEVSTNFLIITHVSQIYRTRHIHAHGFKQSEWSTEHCTRSYMYVRLLKSCQDMFTAIDWLPHAFTVMVDAKPTSAKYYLEKQSDVCRVLGLLVNHRVDDSPRFQALTNGNNSSTNTAAAIAAPSG